MQSWVSQLTTAAVAAFGIGVQPALAAEPSAAFDRAAMLAALGVDTSVPSPECQAHSVGRAVALRALSRPMVMPAGITLQRLDIAAVQRPVRRQL